MPKINYVMGMLVAGGAMTAAADANALTYVLNLPLTSDAASTPITLMGGGTPQNLFGSFANLPGADTTSAQASGLISNGDLNTVPNKADVGLVLGYTIGGSPLTASQWLTDYEHKTLSIGNGNPVADILAGPDATGPTAGVDHYSYLIFDSSAYPNVDYFFGVAHFDAAGTLETIDVSYLAVPEPASWILLIAGAGLAGGALRRSNRRRRDEAIAA